jgi:uncharacterized protein YpiB (UPF0302 family)
MTLKLIALHTLSYCCNKYYVLEVRTCANVEERKNAYEHPFGFLADRRLLEVADRMFRKFIINQTKSFGLQLHLVISRMKRSGTSSTCFTAASKVSASFS